MTKKLLLIDDEEDITNLVGAFLKLKGFEVDCLNDPTAALDRIKNGAYDALVIDLMMFPIDGMTVVRNLRTDPNRASVPVFVISAKWLTDEERKEMMSLKVHYVPKPFHPRHLAEVIRDNLQPA